MELEVSTGFSSSTAPFFSMRTTSVWWLTIRTRAQSSPAWRVTMRSSTRPLSRRETLHIPRPTMSWMRAFCSPLTTLMTSRAFPASPATTPAATAASMPLSPLVLGTTTLLTFLMRFPLAWTSMRSGMVPRVSRARAEA